MVLCEVLVPVIKGYNNYRQSFFSSHEVKIKEMQCIMSHEKQKSPFMLENIVTDLLLTVTKR